MPLTVFNFEGLAPRGGRKVVSPDQPLDDGIGLFNFQAVDRDANVRGEGLGNVIEAGSGRAAATNVIPVAATIFSDEGTFDLRRALFAAATVDGLELTITGFRDGEEVAQRTITLDQEADLVRFGRRFEDLDAVTFDPSGGSSSTVGGSGGIFGGPGPITNPLANNFFVVDNLTVRTHEPDLLLI